MPREQQIDVGSTKGKTIAFSPAYIHLCWTLWPKNLLFHHLKKCVCFFITQTLAVCEINDMGSSNFITRCCLFPVRGSRRFRHFGGLNGGNGVSGAGVAAQSFALPASVLVIRQEDGGYERPSRMGWLELGMRWDGARKHLVNGVMDMTFALLVSIILYIKF